VEKRRLRRRPYGAVSAGVFTNDSQRLLTDSPGSIGIAQIQRRHRLMRTPTPFYFSSRITRLGGRRDPPTSRSLLSEWRSPTKWTRRFREAADGNHIFLPFALSIR
jgi:hypothetical protein